MGRDSIKMAAHNGLAREKKMMLCSAGCETARHRRRKKEKRLDLSTRQSLCNWSYPVRVLLHQLALYVLISFG